MALGPNLKGREKLITQIMGGQCPRRFLGHISVKIVGVSKSNQLHVVIFWLFFNKLEVYSVKKIARNSHEVLSFI